MENPNPNGGGKRPRLVSQSHGVFVGYQKRNRSKPKKYDADDDDDEDPPDDDADEDEDGVVVPKTQKKSLKAHTKTRNPVPFELSLHLAHAYFLRRDLKSALKLLDELFALQLYHIHLLHLALFLCTLPPLWLGGSRLAIALASST